MLLVGTSTEVSAKEIAAAPMKRSRRGNLRAGALLIIAGLATVVWIGLLTWAALAVLGF